MLVIMQTIVRYMDAGGETVCVARHFVIKEQNIVLFSSTFAGQYLDILNVKVFFLWLTLVI